jgi:L-seryl-tRNA(Ser) seleniumtransferase
MDAAGSARFRELPAVDRVITELPSAPGPRIVAAAARRAVDLARARIRSGEPAPSFEEIVAEARRVLDDHAGSLMRRVLNGTGVIVHTNLGRSPLGMAQLDAVAEVAAGYSNLEYEVAAGHRGSRHTHAQRLLTALTGAESALVVNNNAAAVLVTLAALARGKEVIISRGELIEIGGEFRIPDVMAASGATLVEVGTTNRTHLGDYERAVTERTAAILKVHPSNYRMVGFTAAVAARDLARLAQGRKLWFVNDVGSGLVAPGPGADWLADEPLVEDCVAEGADVVTFSGDKLLGGPQAGVIVGRRGAVDAIAKSPLMRAVRPDKMTLAALEATASAYLEGRAADLPLWSMALAPPEVLQERAEAIAASIRARAGTGVKAEATAVTSVTGGGSLPGVELGSWAVTVAHPERSAAEVGRSLRFARVPVVARVEEDRVLIDVRTISPEDDALLVDVVAGALSAPA